MSKIKRPPNANVIQDIKAVRSLTYLLGKLNISPCYYKLNSFSGEEKRFNGWGLKEAKDYVHSKFEYQPLF